MPSYNVTSHPITGHLSGSLFELVVLASATLSLAAVLIIPILLGLPLVTAAVITWPRATHAPSSRSDAHDTAPSPSTPPAATPPPSSRARRTLQPPALHRPAGTVTG